MLILTRRVGEKIRINEDITVVVLGINGMQVRLGVEAPAEVKVHREEIHQRIQSGEAHDQKPDRVKHYTGLAEATRGQV